MTFSSKIKYLLESKNMTQTELAEQLGCRQSVISRWIKTESNNPKMSTLQKISKIFNIPINYFFDTAQENIDSVSETQKVDKDNNLIMKVNLLEEKNKRFELEVDYLKDKIKNLEKEIEFIKNK